MTRARGRSDIEPLTKVSFEHVGFLFIPSFRHSDAFQTGICHQLLSAVDGYLIEEPWMIFDYHRSEPTCIWNVGTVRPGVRPHPMDATSFDCTRHERLVVRG